MIQLFKQINPIILLSLFALVNVFLLDEQRQVYAANGTTAEQIALLRHSIVPMRDLNDNQSIIELIADKPLVLIGDSTHGTHEFYQQRINISKQLIEQKNFKSILLEGDWPSVYRLNQYVQSLTAISIEQALSAHQSEGAWLWGNMETLGFLKWLKNYNQQLPEGEQKVSLYGLDIYSFKQSQQQVLDYLSQYSSFAVQQADNRYQCFQPFNYDLQRYAKGIKNNSSVSCEQSVITQYLDFANCRIPCPDNSKTLAKEAFFNAQQNARVVKNAEKNTRVQALTKSDLMSWNERDRHMMETVIAVLTHLDYPKTIIWAHNSHLGDARATSMAQRQQINLSQLLREQFQQSVFSIGMLTYSGWVMAADKWRQPARLKSLLNAHPESNEALFHSLGIAHFMLKLQQSPMLAYILNKTRLQRHVGVLYRPHDEMASHYSDTHIGQQFDAIIYIDSTRAVTPVKR